MYHTLSRLLIALKLNLRPGRRAVLVCKWGFDGTSCKPFRQKSDDQNNKFDHAVSASVVPLRIVDRDNQQVYWSNPRPNSSRWCRIISINYEKESKELNVNIADGLQSQIDDLKEVTISGVKFIYKMIPTMVDGKVI